MSEFCTEYVNLWNELGSFMKGFCSEVVDVLPELAFVLTISIIILLLIAIPLYIWSLVIDYRFIYDSCWRDSGLRKEIAKRSSMVSKGYYKRELVKFKKGVWVAFLQNHWNLPKCILMIWSES